MSQIFNTILKVKKFLVQWVTEFIHTLREKKNRPKRSTKNCIIYLSYAKVIKGQSVLKTDQRADVSAHAFFSAHEAKKNNTTLI